MPLSRSEVHPSSRFSELRLAIAIRAPSDPSRRAIATDPGSAAGNHRDLVLQQVKLNMTVRLSVRRLRHEYTPSANVEAFARLFEAVHEGVYIGALTWRRHLTTSANPHLKLMFGFAADTPEADVRPFEPDVSSIRRRGTAYRAAAA